MFDESGRQCLLSASYMYQTVVQNIMSLDSQSAILQMEMLKAGWQTVLSTWKAGISPPWGNRLTVPETSKVPQRKSS